MPVATAAFVCRAAQVRPWTIDETSPCLSTIGARDRCCLQSTFQAFPFRHRAPRQGNPAIEARDVITDCGAIKPRCALEAGGVSTGSRVWSLASPECEELAVTVCGAGVPRGHAMQMMRDAGGRLGTT